MQDRQAIHVSTLLLNCKFHEQEREELYHNVSTYFPARKYTLSVPILLSHKEPSVLESIGKFLHGAFNKRNAVQERIL